MGRRGGTLILRLLHLHMWSSSFFKVINAGRRKDLRPACLIPVQRRGLKVQRTHTVDCTEFLSVGFVHATSCYTLEYSVCIHRFMHKFTGIAASTSRVFWRRSFVCTVKVTGNARAALLVLLLLR